jgi:hypothetical protein
MERLGFSTTRQRTMSGHATPLVDAIAKVRAKRNALAGTVRSAIAEMERTPVVGSPDPRARHERQALMDALAALLAPAPTPKLSGIDAELARSIREAATAHQSDDEPVEALPSGATAGALTCGPTGRGGSGNGGVGAPATPQPQWAELVGQR